LTERHDYVIGGGGIYGCGVAWELAKRGADVLLLESGTIAEGASGGAGKRGVRANGRDPRELPLMSMAYEMWPGLEDEIGAPTGYERTGHLLLIEHEVGRPSGGYTSSSARMWLQRQNGIPTELLGRGELRDMEPRVGDVVIYALHCPKDGVADHEATTRGLARAAERLGAEIRERTAVVGLERDGERVDAVITADGERIGVNDTLILLSNTHVPGFVEEQLDVTLPVWSILPQVVFTERVSPAPIRHLIGHDHRPLTMKAIPDGRVMVTGGWRGRWNPDKHRGETIPADVEANLEEAAAVFPALGGVAIDESDASRLESACIDGIPIIDQLPGAKNLVIGTGWSGHGFAISLAVNQLLVDWAYSGEKPTLLHPFSYERFFSRSDKSGVRNRNTLRNASK
jgi:sarcosine oxidase subunit beta